MPKVNVRVPVLTPLLGRLYAVPTHLRGGAVPFFNFVGMVVIPAALLLALGASWRGLGVARPARGAGRAMLASLLLPLGMSVVALARGRIGLVWLFWIVVHNLLSNGLSEEFQSRAVVLSLMRRYASNGWALMVQALLFALPHMGGTVSKEHGAVLIIANIVALNAPMGFTLGVMALRSRSLLLPTVVHISLDTMSRLVGG